MFLRSCAVIAAAAAILSLSCLAQAAGPVATALAGEVRGVESDGVQSFKGVPYAKAPVGDLRWRPPVPAPAWEGVLDGSEFGPACMQPEYRTGSIYAEALHAVSEDCLSLNIWKPADAERAPVFVWIHGGSLRTGAGSQPLYDGAALARSGLVVVTINYRLGVFGYLAHPDLSAESPDGVSGNYGVLDQIAALEWVRDNIESFGGDPDNVTIAGESAGALSVMYLMAAPGARGLFSKAIAQSAYMITTPGLKEKRFGVDAAETVGAQVAEKLGAKDIAALRAIAPQTLMTEAPKAGFAPWGAVDGVVLPRQLVDVFDRGEQAPVPLIAGFNSGEIRSLRFLLPPIPSRDEYEPAIRRGYGEIADRFLALYPLDDIEESMLAATRDAMYGWSSERLALKQAELGLASYLYLFDHGYPAANEPGLHAFHAAELPYMFGTLKKTPPFWPKPPDNEAESSLSAAMLEYWVSFARDGAPAAPGAAAWRPYADERAYMRFAGEARAGERLYPGMYRLHEEVMCRRRAAGDIPWNWNVGVVAPPLPPQTQGCR